ncbi:MAG: PEP/pyruvate-binding domain-containing protein [Thermodesulfobacteriota bacterium]|nr:PEP/pyruvate-binding domain-containing protein [Thermodesulfobacteriota bacterium]
MCGLLKRLFSKGREKETADVYELRTLFKARYHRFKLLLNANNMALDIMAEMEEALRGTWPFGMAFVRSRCTRVSTNVWRIIKHLNELSPGKYEELYERFKDIQIKINPFIRHRTHHGERDLVVNLRNVDKGSTDQVGSKMANIGEISNRLHLKVPSGFVITAQAYHRFMEYNDLQPEIDRRIQAAAVERLDELFGLSADIQQLIIRSALPEDVSGDISEQFGLLEAEEGNRVTVAMRSSALGEDLPGTSFAGQYRSSLNVTSENILETYKEIVAGKYALPAMTYRLNRGIRDEDVAMCVGCMRMVNAVSGGVLYSRNPVGVKGDSIVINSVWGLPKSVVDGSAVSDLFVISREDPMVILQKDIPLKERKFVCYPEEGICRMDMTGNERHTASLSDEQALELAGLGIRLEEYYRVPVDVEWAVVPDGTITVLQCRPLQQAKVRNRRTSEKLKDDKYGVEILDGGVTASPGIAAGPVFNVRKDMDALRFPDGAVLVTAQALPRWATLLNRTIAVVTGQGSLAGHLANVAREFGVPALFAVKGDLGRLKDGEVVTVDADGLRIYAGRIEDTLVNREAAKNLMEGSPVYEALKGAAQYIAPLTLLNPDAPDFNPAGCKTFHDITRFCHEKSVDEMFRFGKEHHFPERSSKQLHCDVPMQWWVLNLDDGFSEEVGGKYVSIDKIISIPMLAIWEGITAIPWEGPPPVDGRGFMSVMFQATANPALVLGARSQYGNRNYFMISKNYCSLNSRLGFHFSTIETLVSDRAGENYISFQFKGGAADYARRVKRIFFLKEILEEYGFRVELNDDNLIARLEGHDKDSMRERLKILGYLTMHSRQLDMIMSNDSKVEYYRSKIGKDIKNIAGVSGEIP